MKRNVAAQAIGCQMTTAADGSEFTGAVTVFLVGDNGTQATGSVGSGLCTHKGHGYHAYAPAQAETNFEHIAFTFAGTGAITGTVQVYTDFPQTGDTFARLGAPAGASVSADVAAVKSDTAAIKLKTDALPPDPADESNTQARFTTLDTSIATLTGFVDTEVAAIKLKTDTLPASPASETTSLAIKAKTDALPPDPADESNTQARFTTLDAAVAAVAAKTNALPPDPADNSDILGAIAGIPAAPSALTIADTVLNRDMGAIADTNSRSPLNALRFLRNKWSLAAGTLTVSKENDATVAWTAAIATDAAALPVTGSDPV